MIRDPDATAGAAWRSPPGSGSTAPTTWWAGPRGSPLAGGGEQGLPGARGGRLRIEAADVLAVSATTTTSRCCWAGRGVAMGQAVEVVLEAADAVAGTVYDEGAATELVPLDEPAAPTSPTSTARCCAPTAPCSASAPPRCAWGARRGRGGRLRHRAAVALDDRPLGGTSRSRGLAVVSNGALLLDVATGQPLEVHGIEREVRLPLVDAVRGRVPGCAFAIELAGISLEPGYLEPGARRPAAAQRQPGRPVERTGAQAPGGRLGRGSGEPPRWGPRRGPRPGGGSATWTSTG